MFQSRIAGRHDAAWHAELVERLGLGNLLHRYPEQLSGGQQQRVAIGSVLTTHPRVLVLDEPTSALDPAAAEDVLAALQRLVHDLGLTVLLAEHRLERVVQYADRVIRPVSMAAMRRSPAREPAATTCKGPRLTPPLPPPPGGPANR